MSVSDRKPNPLSRSLKAAAPGQVGRFIALPVFLFH
jgi:hypothetical protein